MSCRLDEKHCSKLLDRLLEKCIFSTSTDQPPVPDAFSDLRIFCDNGKNVVYANSAVLHTIGNELATAVRLIEVIVNF